jgi:membrane fusion protein (multidrug efflux system)
LLLPGMFVRATVDLGTNPKAFLVPQRAVTFNSAGQPTAYFVEGGKAVTHVLTTSGNINNDWVVTDGVKDGAQLVVDGLQKISDGSAVSPVAVTLDAEGVATDAAPAGTAAPAAKPAAAGATGSGG